MHHAATRQNKARSSRQIVAELCTQLEQIRISRNMSQKALAASARVSRSTLTRMANGQSLSLDSFVRIMQALDLDEHLATLLPYPTIRPVERLRFDGQQRKRASRPRRDDATWEWADDKVAE